MVRTARKRGNKGKKTNEVKETYNLGRRACEASRHDPIA